MRLDQRYAGSTGLRAFNESVKDTLVSQEITPRNPDNFHAHLVALDFAGLRCVAASVGALRALRRPRDAERAEGSIFLLLSSAAHGAIRHRYGSEPIQPDRLVIVPGGEPFDVQYDGPARVVFLALDRTAATENGMRLDGPIRSQPLAGLAQVTSRQLHDVVAATSDPDVLAARAIVQATLQLVVRAAMGDSNGDPLAALRVAVQRAIALNLTTPELDIPWLARQLHVSPRQIHRAFEPTPWTTAEYIREQRLQACAADLAADPRLSITAAAARYGFASTSHLSSSFRRRFGEAPTTWRHRHESDSTRARV